MRGLLICKTPYHDIVSRRIGFANIAKNRESIVHGVGEKYSGRFKKVFGDGRVVDEAGFDEMSMNLVEVFAGFAFL